MPPGGRQEAPNDAPVAWPSNRAIVVGRPTQSFEPRVVDPGHHPAPYRPDTSLDGWTSEFFTIRAASVRGHLHRYAGVPRQDDFAVALHEGGEGGERLLVAIADGVSSASQSHIGSTTAVRYALQWLSANPCEVPAETDWTALVESTAWALVEQASAIYPIERDAEQAESLVATTLVCAVVEPNPAGGATAHVVGVGDSGAWVLADGRYARIEGGKAESEGGLTSSAVRGLPRVPRELHTTSIDVEPDQLLLLGTDGFGDPLGDGTGEVGGLFASVLLGRVPSLIEFAHVLDFSRETFDDDRTLVAVWPPGGKGA